jgi:eukaryotic-like serine/threonine-protein kinase
MSEAPSWNLSEGDQIAPGRFAIEPIGEGRRYETYLVWDDKLHALGVAKLLRRDQISDPEALRVINDEAIALGMLRHPHLVRGFDAVLAGGRPHLLLELVEGPRLSTLSRRYGIVAEQLMPLALCVCSALHFMHRRGYVHLDVKPRNIIMGATPRLIDLSLTRSVAAARRIVAPTGTDRYMAPEQCDPARHPGEIGPPADIWGLGVTLYEALAGHHPWTSEEGERFPQLLSNPDPLEATAPPQVLETLEGCLERRPEDRPTAAEIAAALEPAVDALPAPRIGRFRPGASWRRESGPSASVAVIGGRGSNRRRGES